MTYNNFSRYDRISIALCTYNGGAHLGEQLASILAQTRQADEIVICDDLSNDNTIAIARQMLTGVQARVNIHVNEERLGSTRNFGAALSRCTGDVIFLADQDDVWLPNKIERMLAKFDEDLEVTAVFCDSAIVGPNLEPTGSTMFGMLCFTSAERVAVIAGQSESLLARPLVTGAALAIRATLLPALLPAPIHSHMIHDRWAVLLATACGRVVPVDEVLVLYRQHAGQQVGAPNKWGATDNGSRDPRESHRKQLGFYRDLKQLLAERRAPVKSAFAVTLDAAIAHLTTRTTLPAARPLRIVPIGRELASSRYRRFSSGWRSVARDLLL